MLAEVDAVNNGELVEGAIGFEVWNGVGLVETAVLSGYVVASNTIRRLTPSVTSQIR